MDEKALREIMLRRGSTEKQIFKATGMVKEFEEWLAKRGKELDSANVESLKEYIDLLISKDRNTDERLRSLMRYYYATRKNDLYYYLAATLGGAGVYESIAEKLESVAGKHKREAVFEGFRSPPLGSSPDLYPPCTRELLKRLSANLPNEKVREALTGNHHRIPVSAFAEKKRRFEAAETIDDYLVGEHRILVDVLEQAMREGRPWYEQEITPEVLEFVKGDQTIQNGVRAGDIIVVSKIPFDPQRWLNEKDPRKRRYHACHCPLARAAILDGNAEALKDFCYCSAGYEKLSWDVVFGEPVEVKVLESVLAGDDRCRFSIKIPRGKMK
jgi:hypothetical protein